MTVIEILRGGKAMLDLEGASPWEVGWGFLIVSWVS